eukprot:g32956.t1
MCVANGMAWLGRFQATRGRVLIVDYELHPETLANRLPAVARALELQHDDYADAIDVLSLRGRIRDIYQLQREIDEIENGEYSLVIVDAFYRALSATDNENSNADIMRVFNRFDQYAKATGAAFLCVHHTSKGAQGDKSVTDTGSGAGSQSRAADTHIVMRPHEEDNHVVLEAALRSWKPVEPLVLQWNFPLWIPVDGKDPKKLKGRLTRGDQKRNENDQRDMERILGWLAGETLTTNQIRNKLGSGLPRATKLLTSLEDGGDIISEPTDEIVEIAKAGKWNDKLRREFDENMQTCKDAKKRIGELKTYASQRLTSFNSGAPLSSAVGKLNNERRSPMIATKQLDNFGFESHRDFLKSVMQAGMGGQADNRLQQLAAGSDEQSGASDAYGGFLIPTAFAPNLLSVSNDADPTAGLTMKIPLGPSGKLEIPARVDKNHSSSVSGGLRVYRRVETQSVSDSRMEFEQVKFDATSLTGVTYASEEVLSRSAVAFTALLEQGFSDEFSSKLMDEKLNGTGAGMYEGVLNTPCKIAVTKEVAQAANTILYENVIAMRARCWGYSNAVWLANHDTLPQLLQMNADLGTGGALVWQPSIREDHPDMLLGRPLYFNEMCKTLGTEGDIVLGNWSQYLEAELAPLQHADSMHALSQLRFAAQQSGTDFETLEKSMFGLSRSVFDLSRGSATARAGFGALGLQMRDLKGLKPEQQLGLIADRMNKFSDVATRGAIAQQIFGRAGRQMLPMLAGGSKGIKDLTTEADKLGLTIGGKQAKAAAEFADGFNRLKQQGTTALFQIGAAIFETFDFKSVMAKLSAFAGTFKKDWLPVIVGIFDVVKTQWTFTIKAFTFIWDNGLGRVVKTLAFAVRNWKQLFQLGFEYARLWFGNIPQLFINIKDSGIEIFMSLARGIGMVLKETFSQILDNAKRFAKALGDAIKGKGFSFEFAFEISDAAKKEFRRAGELIGKDLKFTSPQIEKLRREIAAREAARGKKSTASSAVQPAFGAPQQQGGSGSIEGVLFCATAQKGHIMSTLTNGAVNRLEALETVVFGDRQPETPAARFYVPRLDVTSAKFRPGGVGHIPPVMLGRVPHSIARQTAIALNENVLLKGSQVWHYLIPQDGTDYGILRLAVQRHQIPSDALELPEWHWFGEPVERKHDAIQAAVDANPRNPSRRCAGAGSFHTRKEISETMAQKKLKTASAYIRMSSDKQEDSPERQRKEILRYAEQQGFHVECWYEDHAISGGESHNRPDFQRLLADVNAGKIKTIIVYENSRLSREDIFAAMAHFRVFHDAGASVHSVMRGEMRLDDLGGIITAMVGAHEANAELLKIASRAASGKEKKAQDGHRTGRSLFAMDRVYFEGDTEKLRVLWNERFRKPMGWRQTITPSSDTKAVAALQWAFRHVGDGGTITDVVREFNRRGIPTMNGREWKRPTVKRILTNPVYMGVLRAGEFSGGKYASMQERYWFDNAHPAIVTRDEFQRAQDAIEAGERTIQRRYDYLLPGLVYCACGSRMYGNTHIGKCSYRRYFCSTEHSGRDCKRRAIVDCERLEMHILGLVREHVLCDENRDRLIEVAKRESAAGEVAISEQRELDAVDRKIESVKRNLALAEGGDEFRAISEVFTELREQRDRLEKTITSAIDRVIARSEFIEAIDHMKEFRERLESADRGKLRIALSKTVDAIIIESTGRRPATLSGTVTFREDVYDGPPIELHHRDIGYQSQWRLFHEYAIERGCELTCADFADEFDKTTRQCNSILRDAERHGVLRRSRIGKRNKAYWLPAEMM